MSACARERKRKTVRALLWRAPVMALPVILLHPYFRSRPLPLSGPNLIHVHLIQAHGGRAAETILFGISAV